MTRTLRLLPTMLLGCLGLVLVWTAATVSLDPGAQTVVALGSLAVFLIGNRAKGHGMTLFLTMLSAIVSLRYIVWRFTETLDFTTVGQGILGFGLAVAEFYAIIVLALGYIQTAWPLERKPVPLPDDPDQWPTVDIYVPTYNEDISIVRPTVLAALRIDWPADKLRVYILDDGRRTVMRDLAEECGAGYIIRPDNKHAKAGNLNHAMKLTDGEFIAVLDCDHIPTRAFLQTGLGWLIKDDRLAFVQTPHHFYSPDPFQRNLAAGQRVPPEGNLFYGLIQDGNDFWNAAFFCGSCAIIRRKALDQIGGFATSTVTEDAHTALRLHRNGWHSAYLRLPLAAGLATERLMLHIGQRVRWARGMLQILRTDNPMFGPGLTIGQRICYVNAMMHFLFAVPRIVFLTSPLAFLLFGQNIIAASPLAIMAYAMPHLVLAVATNARIQKSWRHSFWSEIYETVLALFLVRITIVTMLSPRRGKFNVTEKGGVLESGYFDLRAVYPNLILLGVLMVGLGRGVFGMVFETTTQIEFQSFLLNSIWTLFSILVVMAALAVGRETRQLRNQARIRARLPATVWLPDGRAFVAHSQDLSLGGAALAIERPEDVVQNSTLEMEFEAAGRRLVVPAAIERWDGDTLQVRWQMADVRDESNVVQLVFGRSDAWTDWNRYPVDRPLVSLLNVLASIKGFFRLPGNLLRSGARPAPATPQTATPAVLARQTMVLQPRVARMVPAIIAGLVGAGLTLPAHAQTQAGAQSQAGAQAQATAQPATAQPATAMQAQAAMPVAPGGPPLPNLPLPSLPATPAPFRIPSTPAATPAQPSGASRADSRTVVYTMRELGAFGPMTMRGTSTIQGLLFGIAADEVVVEAHLTLNGAFSPSLLPDYSNITVTLNEQYAGTIPVTSGRPEFGPMDIPVNPVFFQDRNRLNFRFAGRYTQDCNDQLSGLLWATVSDTSTLSISVVRLPAQRDLTRLPRPFFDANLTAKAVIPFVMAEQPSIELVQAAGVVASWFGKLTDNRGVSFPVSAEPPAEGNAVLLAVARDLPHGLNMGAVTGPTIAELANPNDAFGTILVLTGPTPADVAAAANTLSLGGKTLAGQHMTVKAPVLPLHMPNDAPAWIPTDRPVRLGEIVEPSILQGTGYVPGTMHVPFRTAPDLYTWRRRPYSADIRFRAPPGPIIDAAASRLDVSLNSIYLRSYSLAPTDTTVDWVLRQLGYARPVHYAATPLPAYDVYGQNDLQLYFDSRPMDRGDCAAVPQDIHNSIDPDSTIDLSNGHHFTSMPNLSLFVGSGFPFTRMADLSETVVVIPDQPGSVELSAYLNMMGYLGSLTFQPVNRVTVSRASQAGTISPDRDVLVIGTLGHMLPAADLLGQSPYSIEPGGVLKVALSTPWQGLRHAFGDRTGEERQRLATVLSAPLTDGSAALIGAAAPHGNQRSVMALLAGTPQGLSSMIDALRDPKQIPQVQGDLALLSGGSVTSFRTGGSYTVGSLPFWMYPEWLLQDRGSLLIPIILSAAAAVAFVFFRLLRWHAGRRVTGRPAKIRG